jgi:hypothetical protein
MACRRSKSLSDAIFYACHAQKACKSLCNLSKPIRIAHAAKPPRASWTASDTQGTIRDSLTQLNSMTDVSMPRKAVQSYSAYLFASLELSTTGFVQSYSFPSKPRWLLIRLARDHCCRFSLALMKSCPFTPTSKEARFNDRTRRAVLWTRRQESQSTINAQAGG